ncbi:MAG TPA: redoxin domain-containing protein [Anaerolineales bacterium]|nr:redoxin domain-containing protein [Anaerolineales bacterium]
MTPILSVGRQLPELGGLTPEGKATTISAHLGPRNTLLFFMHGAWCPECVGQLHLLQRYRPRINAAGADILVLTSDDLETLETFLRSAVPPLEYTVLADPKRVTYQKIGAGGHTVAMVVDSKGVIRWLTRWLDHQQEPGYDEILQALRGAAE